MLAQTQILETIHLALAEPELEALPIYEPVLPTLVMDYLDVLLQTGTEFPEKRLRHFECLKFISGGIELLMPLSRIRRIDIRNPIDKFYRVKIPECEGEENLTLSLEDNAERICIDSVIEICRVNHDMVLWRDEQHRAPWFVGTHKHFLCRIFDPNRLIDDLRLAK